MDLSSAIITSTGILAGTATLWRLFLWNKKGNPGNNNALRKDVNDKLGRMVFKDTCDAYREGEERQSMALQKAVSEGFTAVNNQLRDMRKEIRERIK